ncbi:unnamed protein product [Fraxinus pennsylvanica]|uniref:Uncharacterized protein n=1 Tax=Fraxinus pennsylvanica TaxID=56036 RepID=A0AAD1ZPL4_9LAMI|nr:unnamed protein product [Fraxinus pennsylvanica]
MSAASLSNHTLFGPVAQSEPTNCRLCANHLVEPMQVETTAALEPLAQSASSPLSIPDTREPSMPLLHSHPWLSPRLPIQHQPLLFPLIRWSPVPKQILSWLLSQGHRGQLVEASRRLGGLILEESGQRIELLAVLEHHLPPLLLNAPTAT